MHDDRRMYDKLSIINTALIRTGNNPCNFEGDGSDEWTCGSDAYESELPNILADHDWGFATSTAPLTRVGDSPDPRFCDAFERPIGALHIEAVWINHHQITYDMIDNLIVCNAGTSFLPVCKFVATPENNQWPPHFVEALRQRVMSHIYRGLNEDTGEADKLYAASEMTLQKARSRSDQERPARALVINKLARARRHMRGGLNGSYRDGNFIVPME